jgi:hypothetical protein
MSWPAASHFSLSLQNPRAGLRSRELHSLRVTRDKLGQPRPWSGAFAVVFQGTDPGGRSVALRAFTSDIPERIERYHAISTHLARQRPRCLVGFQLQPEGIRSASNGKWYPLIVMDWVRGETLFDWVRTRCEKRDQAALNRIATAWVGLVEELSAAGIAHGDLQHANVMVTDAGELKLVDYDCLAVPSLMGRFNLEIGVDPYQHPARAADTRLSATLDRFSALMIWTSLKAFAADPTLWNRFVEPPNQSPYDKLLIRREDIHDPARSTLVREFERSRDNDVSRLFEALVAAAKGPINSVPKLSEALSSRSRPANDPVFDKLRAAAAANAGRLLVALWDENAQLVAGHPSVAALAPIVNGWRNRNRLCDEFLALARKPGADAAAVAVAWTALDRAGGHPDAEAFRRGLAPVADRLVAWAAFQSVPRDATEHFDQQRIAAWREGVFAHWPEAERERPRVVQSRQRLEQVARLRAVDRAGVTTESGEQQIVAGCRQLPADYSPDLAARSRLAIERLTALARLRDLLRGAEVSDIAVAVTWEDLLRTGAESLASPAERQRAELALERKPLIVALRQIPTGTPADQRDKAVLKIWKPELLDDCADVWPWKTAYAEAVSRFKVLKKVRTALVSGDDLAAVQGLGNKLLANFPLPNDWNDKVKAAKTSAGTAQRLVEALRANDFRGFMAAFDAAALRRSPDLFVPHRPMIDGWLEDLLSAYGTPQLPRHHRPGIHFTPRGPELRWTWPDVRIAETCRVSVGDDGDDALFEHTLTRRDYERAGGRLLLPVERGWAGATIVVQAELDAGFGVFVSPSLVLGRLGSGRLVRK